MSTAYFSLTAGGSLLALKLQERFGGTAHLPQCHSLGCGHCTPFDDLAEALPASFSAGDDLVCIMAAGIVFRLLAPHLGSKHDDPAVLVIDEDGRFVVPLLGGHAAGANSLAREIADYLGTEAAITTASDVLGLTAPDEVARQLGAKVDDPAALRKVTALLVDGRPVCIEAVADPGIGGYGWVPPGGSLDGYAGRLLLSPMADVSVHELPTVRLIPRRVVAGIGCRRGAQACDIVAAVEDTCRENGVETAAVALLASIDAKQDEEGLAQAALGLGTGLRFFPSRDLAALGRPGSDFVAEKMGTPAVSEPAALLAAGEGAKLLAGKTARDGITVALALSMDAGEFYIDRGPVAVASVGPGKASGPDVNARPEDGPAEKSAATGEVMVVGTGAGTAALLTAEAREAIVAADTVVGYRTYVDQVKDIFPEAADDENKRFISGSMGRERERCREALELAASGHRVALVSSGDPGVYGMAGLLLEMADGLPVSVFPGVTAAQIAAARLGAPLMNDYITLSLSDLLTPRDEVLRRAEIAAASGMVICLYNPASRKRRPLFDQVCRLLLGHRPPETVTGWVRNAGGPGEEAAIIRLDGLPQADIDMRTIVIIGNDFTQIIGGRMVTRRGYERKGPKQGQD